MSDAAIYSSDFVCNRIAERTLRELEGHVSSATRKFADLMSPVADVIAKSKLKRGSLRGYAETLVSQLSQ